MSDFPPIAGVSLEQYANLCVAMAETGGDEAQEIAIAQEAGVSPDAWLEAKAGWTSKMQDPADGGKTAYAFMPFYQAAQAANRGGGEPCPIELFAKVTAEYSFEKDDDGEQVKPAVIFARHGITASQWNEFTSYWTPKVNDPADPSATEFRVLMQAESDRIFGIVRDANGSAIDPDDIDPDADQGADQGADHDADDAEVTDANAEVPDLSSQPTRQSTPPPPPPTTQAAAPKPPLAPAAKPAAARPVSAPTASAPVATTSSTAVANDPDSPDLVPGLTEDEKMWAAGVHACAIIGLGLWGPLIVYLIYQDPEKSDFVRFHAKQAAMVHLGVMVGVIVIGVITCGLGTVLLLPWMALELWIAWEVYQGKRTSYPMLGRYEGGA